MDPSTQELPEDYDRPVAYDANGKPLYAHPPAKQALDAKEQKPDDLTKVPTGLDKNAVSSDVELKHKRSQRAFPRLELDEDEYVVNIIRRHWIGLVIPITMGVFLVVVTLYVLSNYKSMIGVSSIIEDVIGPATFTLFGMIFIGLIILGTCVAYYVYIRNRLFVTNERIIQEVHIGIFSETEKSVRLGDIEGVSYERNGIIQQFFDFGTIILNTQGYKIAYIFTYAPNPEKNADMINEAVDNFKESRRRRASD